jgi:hypothetical protein
MTEMERLIELSLDRLWAPEIAIDARGEVTFNIGTLGDSMHETRKLALKRAPLTWSPFELCASPEGADAACNALLEAMRELAKRSGKRPPRTTEEKLARLMQRSAWRQSKKLEAVGANDEPW